MLQSSHFRTLIVSKIFRNSIILARFLQAHLASQIMVRSGEAPVYKNEANAEVPYTYILSNDV